MLEHEGDIPVIQPGIYPPELLDACKVWQTAPESLLAWAVTDRDVQLVLGSGQKVRVHLAGPWSEKARRKKD
jgi:hypothetical protein